MCAFFAISSVSLWYPRSEIESRSPFPSQEATREKSDVYFPTELHIVNTPSFLSLIHISEPTRRTPISYAVFCLKKKKNILYVKKKKKKKKKDKKKRYTKKN